MTDTLALACKVDKDNLRKVEIDSIVVHCNLNGARHNKSNTNKTSKYPKMKSIVALRIHKQNK